MLFRRILLGCRKSLTKRLSTAPLQNVETKNLEDAGLGNEKPEHLDVLKHPDYFNVGNMFTIKDLFDKRVHYGHKVTSLNPRMKEFLFGSRLGHLIFDLNITAEHLKRALNFAAHIAYRDGVILFVSRNPSITLLVERIAAECKEYAITREWKMGTFTDSTKIFNSVVRLPDLCIFLNTLEENGFEHLGIRESSKMLIPTIAIVDSNCNPEIITYPVPGNDDSIVTLSYYCHLFKEAILRGKNKRLEHMNSDKNESKTQKPASNESEPSS